MQEALGHATISVSADVHAHQLRELRKDARSASIGPFEGLLTSWWLSPGRSQAIRNTRETVCFESEGRGGGMAYAADLNSAAARHRGSNPLPGTTTLESGVDDKFCLAFVKGFIGARETRPPLRALAGVAAVLAV